MQKTYTLDCITHKVMKNNGERPMYLVTDHHDPIVDSDTFNRVQQELARRSSKRKISDKTKTERKIFAVGVDDLRLLRHSLQA